jgi:PAS domain S-box-containing protein
MVRLIFPALPEGPRMPKRSETYLVDKHATERQPSESAIAKSNERLRVLHQIDIALISGEDPESIAAAALPPLRDLLGVRRVIVNLFDLATGEVEWLAAVGRRRVRVGPGVRYSIQFMGEVEALKRGEPQFIDVRALPAGPEVDALLASGVDTYMVVPMIVADGLIGSLSFGGFSEPITEEILSIAKEAAAQFAIALTQARLHERVQRQARELEIKVRELRESEELLRNAFEHSNMPMVLTDMDHRFVRLNSAFANLFGYSEAEMLRMSMPDITHLDDVAESLSRRQALNVGEVQHFQMEKRYRHKDGHIIWGLANISLVRDMRGQPVQYFGQVQDVTDRKRMEEQIRQSQKMDAIGQLAGGVAHDFNNLLTIISGYSEILTSRMSADDPTRALINEIHKAGERAAMLTRQLLVFSRKAIVEPRVLDLNAIVTDIDRMLRRLIGEDINVTTSLDPSLGRVKADAGQVDQIILNLAINARDAMPGGGKLTIETANVELDENYVKTRADVKPGPYVMLAVSDTGCGMSEETKARIFEPFFTTKGVGKGTGLGLATVFGIVKQFGGHIGVYSETGHGSTFKVYFPLVTELSAGKPSHGVKSAPHGVETILLVEDEDAVREMTRFALQSHGYTVLVSSCGLEAINISTRHQGPIHLLVTDVVMPNIGGRQLAERLAEQRPDMKVLYLSGYTDDAIIRHGILKAEASFLQKPFTPIALALRVREVLGSTANIRVD